MRPEHLATARLLVEVASEVFEGESFALKGGTAINFFLRDLPRLSVDLDLVLTDYRLSREEALETIQRRLLEAKGRLDERGLNVQLLTTKDTLETKLLVRRGEGVSPVFCWCTGGAPQVHQFGRSRSGGDLSVGSLGSRQCALLSKRCTAGAPP